MKKLLDREPTPEMVGAADKIENIHPSVAAIAWCVMWDAAPALPEPGEAEKWLRSKCYCDGGHRGTECIPCGAADLIAELTVSRDAWLNLADKERQRCDAALERAEKAEAENERLRERAERYEWVRKNCEWVGCGDKVKWVFWLNMKEPDISGPLTDESVPVQLDAAIDDAKGKP